jgi:hypothetical protein
MITKGNKIYSIVYSKCPKCNEGNMFEHPNPYYLPKIAIMPQACDVCKQSTLPEPGFFFGAMYVSYALAVALGLVIGIPMLFLDFSAEAVIIAISLALLLLSPILFRWSRMIWFNMFYHYDKNLAKGKI